jgi:protein kinase-like protein
MLSVGTIVSGYRIEAPLGEGGMATVYEANQVALDRVVALKVLAKRFGDDPGFQERFQRECQIQARLDHPHIVPIYAAGESEYGLWLAMRLVKGPTLRELLLARRLSPEQTLSLLAPIAEALDVAHDRGLIHRDITPQNILVEENEHPYLSDFGITRGRGDRSLTQTGQFLGTLDYVAPEQIRDEPTFAATDTYALGAVLFECLTGRVPFDKASDAAVLYAHLSEEPPRAGEVGESLPRALDRVLRKALAKRPADRYDRASELIAETARALESPRPERPHPVSGDGGGSGTRRRAAALLASTAAVLIAFALGMLTSGEAKSDTRDFVSGSLAVGVPRGWTAAKVGKSPIAGLPLESPAVLSSGREGQTVTVGISGATGKRLLPPTLHPRSASGEPVALGDLEALRYRRLNEPGSGAELAVFAVPTQSGVATVTCRPDAGNRSFFDLCQRIASTLRVVRGAAYPLGPSPTLASGLRRQLTHLDRRRAKLMKRLASAESATGQAASSAALAAAFRDAARGLASLVITPQSAVGQAAVVGALRSARNAYKDLASAALDEDSSAYDSAAGTVARAEDHLDRSLRSLEHLGYRIGALASLWRGR